MVTRLDEIRARYLTAPPALLKSDLAYLIVSVMALRGELARRDAAIVAVRELHGHEDQSGLICQEGDCEACIAGEGHTWTVCTHCEISIDGEIPGVIPWPCPTIQGLDAHLEGT